LSIDVTDVRWALVQALAERKATYHDLLGLEGETGRILRGIVTEEIEDIQKALQELNNGR